MTFPRSRVPGALTMTVGLALGWGLATFKTPVLRATGTDRAGDSILASGPVQIRYHDGLKVQMTQDAIYYLDYKAGRLIVTIPSHKQTGVATKYIESFAERDLVADFKLDPDHGPRPHFMMTTGGIGIYSDGWAPLFVFESTTGQVAVYRIQQQSLGTVNRPQFDLLEVRSFAREGSPTAAR